MSIGIISIVSACIVVGIIVVTILALRRIVPTNQVHIVQRNNKTVSYGKDTANGNVYYEIPSWVPKFGVVVSKLPATIIDISLNHYEAYDKDRLPFVVDVKAFFRITDFAIAASRIPTLEELYDQLTSIVQGAVRSILAKE
jgi:flotillin